MTLRLADPDAIYRVPAVIDMPGDDGPTPRACTLHFLLLEADEVRQAIETSDLEFLRRVLRGWDGIEQADGSPLERDAAALAMLAAKPWFVRGVSAAYDRFVLGLPGKTPTPSGGDSSAADGTKPRTTPLGGAST